MWFPPFPFLKFRLCFPVQADFLNFFSDSNKLDLALMKKNFGIDASKFAPEPKRKTSIKRAVVVVVFLLRCKRYADEWTEQKKVKGALNKALEEARRGVLMRRIEAKGRKG